MEIDDISRRRGGFPVDMRAVGQEMQALEMQLLARHAQKPVAPGLRI